MIEPEADELTELKGLKTEAPTNTMLRLRKRLRALQLGRDLMERQAFAFWIVLDTLLRLFFGKPRVPQTESESEMK